MLKINRIFNHHHELKPLLDEAFDRQQLQQLWSVVAPELSKLSQVLAVEDGILTIGAQSGAVASKIRLLETGLIRRIGDFCENSQKIKGLNLSAIKVKVQVKSRPPAKQKRIQSPSNQALNTLEACADKIENPALEAALRHFIDRQRDS
ncbi:MAG: DciA family protein [Methylophilus sp.]|uniref:DciA family protein n=1 Tax=Methylophilus sp. TaxID=29541 RepID=UPI003FA091F0